MQELNQLFSEATASIDHLYFQLPIDGSDPIFRERVYCYELYHQLRRIWPPHSPFKVNGEVDKQGHRRIQATGARAASPDLLIHIPGSMAENHAIIEIKPGSARFGGIRKDIRTLSEYQTRAGYRRALYLFYGRLPEQLIERALDAVTQIDGPVAPIELWFHPQPGMPAELVRMLP